MSHIMTLAETPSATEMKKKKSQNKPELTTAAVAASIVMPGVIGGWLMIKGSVSVSPLVALTREPLRTSSDSASTMPA